MRHTFHGLAAVAALTACALGVLAGCSSPPEVVEEVSQDVEVTGEFAAAPTLSFDTPLVIERPSYEVIWEGDGPVAEPGETILLNLYAQNGTNRAQIVDTFFELPRIFSLTEQDMSTIMLEAISQERAGSRILVLEEDEGTPIALVLDMLAGQADGEPVKPRSGLPKVTLGVGGAPSVTVSKKLKAKPPQEIVVQPLIRGIGRPIQDGQTVIVQYTALTWSDAKIIDSTWDDGRTPFTTIVGDSRPIVAWDEALIEQPVGSQVLLVAPPAVAYGGSNESWAQETIIFVIDILWAGTLEAPEMGTDEGHNSDEGGREQDASAPDQSTDTSAKK